MESSNILRDSHTLERYKSYWNSREKLSIEYIKICTKSDFMYQYTYEC